MTTAGATIYATDNPVIVTHGRFRWHCVGGAQAELFSPDAPNWANPGQDKRFELVKANSARRIYRIRHRNQDYYIKLYRPVGFYNWIRWLFQGPPSKREFSHLRTAARRHTPVPVPVAWGEGIMEGRTAAALITPSLGEVDNLEGLVWSDKPANSEYLPDILAAAGGAIAQLHCAGIIHQDLHAGNILIENARNDRPKKAYLTDLQAASVESRSGHPSADPAQKNRQANLAAIVAALKHKLPESTWQHLVDGYLRAMQPHQTMNEEQRRRYDWKLQALARRHDEKVMRSRQRRCLRNSRYARRIKLADGWSAQVYLQHRFPKEEYLSSRLTFTADDWKNALVKPEALLAGGTVIKQGGHSTVGETELQMGSHVLPVIIKHIRVREGLRGWWQAVRRSRALRQWFWAHAFIIRDVPTAWPLAAVERRRWGLAFESIFITEKIADAHNLKIALLENQNLPPTPRDRYELCRKIGELLHQLDYFGLNHRDCKVSNILIQKMRGENDNTFWRPYLIDLDGLSRCYGLRFFKRHQAIIRLAASSLELAHVTRRDRVAVFCGYLSDNYQTKHIFRRGDCEKSRRVWRQISRQVLQQARTTGQDAPGH